MAYSRNFIAVVVLLCALPALAQDGRAPRHPALINADLPPLIPAETFFAQTNERWAYRVSPDGLKLLWLALKNDLPTIHFQIIGEEDIQTIDAGRPVYWAYWAADSRHITAWWDQSGDENYHFIAVDIQTPGLPPRDVTPYPGVRVYFQQYFPRRPMEYLVRHNRRDRSVTDLYRINALTGEETLIDENPGDVFAWVTDQTGAVAARLVRLPQYGWSLRVPGSTDKDWRELAQGTADDVFEPKGHPPPGADFLWARSNRGRDRIAVVKVDLASGRETVFYEHPLVDVTWLWVDPLTYKPNLAWSYPGHPEVMPFTPALEADLDLFAAEGPFGIDVKGRSFDKTVLTYSVSRDRSGESFYLVDRKSGTKLLLARSSISAHSRYLAEMRPISFPARDGLAIHGYLTLPQGTAGKNLPMVLRVHGGPFWRDFWGYDATDQFLANRGYAVLRLNYRGSDGYGRSFTEAAKREFAGKMHDDLIDGVNWAIRKGIADPDAIAIYGHSYGGYATLVGLTFTPEIFAAGVDVVGVADLVTLLETVPAYWKLRLPYWHLYVGNPADPTDRDDMARRSPINFVERIKKPLLVAQGANDVRVVRQHSDRIVETMRAKGLDVEYIVFEDEGHSIRRWRNRVELARAMERFLAKHLGGRSASQEP